MFCLGFASFVRLQAGPPMAAAENVRRQEGSTGHPKNRLLAVVSGRAFPLSEQKIVGYRFVGVGVCCRLLGGGALSSRVLFRAFPLAW